MFVEETTQGISAQVLRPVYDMLAHRQEILDTLKLKFSLPLQEQIGEENVRVSAEQLRGLFSTLIESYGYRDIGLSTGSNLSVGCFGSYSYLLMSADNLQQSLDSFCEYYKAITDMPRPPRWVIDGDEFFLELYPSKGDVAQSLVATDLTLAATYRLLQHAAPADFRLSEVHICGDGGGYRGRYRDCFDCNKLTFNADSMRLYASTRFLQMPLPNANRTLSRVFKKELTMLLSALDSQQNIIDRIHRILSRCENVAKINIRDIANQLGVGERSLTRQLGDYNITFRELLSNYKSSRSVRLLAEGHSVDEVCFHLGFSERAAFDRAFKKWQGVTASRFQEEFRCSGGDPAQLFVPEQLPNLPAVARQLLELIEADNCDMGELAKVVEQDPGLTAKLMALANSALYGVVRTTTIKEAIIKIFGVERLRNISLAMLANDCFDTSRCVGFSLQHYWTVALGTGQLSSELAKASRHIDPEQTYLLGLLHDIGSLLLVQMRSDEMEKYFSRKGERDLQLTEICALQRQMIGVDAFSVGAMLTSFWNLPRYLSAGIRGLTSEEDNGEFKTMSELVAVSELIVRQILHGKLDQQEACPGLAKLTGLDAEDILPLLNQFSQRIDNLKAAASGLI